MGRAWFAVLLALGQAACNVTEPNPAVTPQGVDWMEWPAEVVGGMQFQIRVIGLRASCRGGFGIAVTQDSTALRVEPFATPALPGAVCDDGLAAYDTLVTVSGLAADSNRVYAIHAPVCCAIQLLTSSRSRRPLFVDLTFGEVVVRPSSADRTRTNASGYFQEAYYDSLTCVRIRPVSFASGYVDENWTPVGGVGYNFVRGYLYAPATPVCGERVVFHEVSHN